MLLNIQKSCEIENLIDVIMNDTNKSYDEIEKALMNSGNYPESKKTFLMLSNGSLFDKDFKDDYPNDAWIENSLIKILKDNNIKSIYITTAI